LDFTLPGFSPADNRSRHRQDTLLLDEGRYSAIARQDDGDQDFVLLAEPGLPGSSYYEHMRTLAVHVVRDPALHTFTIDWHSAPTTALTVAWLLERGAEEEHFRVDVGPEDAPADVTSAQIEARIRRSGSRYTVVDSDDTEPLRSWVLLHDREPAASARPYLVQIRTELARGGFRLREGSFADPQSAQQWLEDPRQPLPPPVLPDPVLHAQAVPRSRAAVSLSSAGAGRGAPETASTSTLPQLPGQRPRNAR